MRKNGFCEHKFRSMLLTGTFTMAVIYIMLLCDNMIFLHKLSLLSFVEAFPAIFSAGRRRSRGKNRSRWKNRYFRLTA